jgi:hypothetical protein
MGVEEPRIVCMFTKIQNLHQSICSVYGDSKLTFFGQIWTVPIQGDGQGSGAGPQIWAVGSTPSSTCDVTKGTGPTFGQLSLVLLSALSATLLWTIRFCVLPVKILIIPATTLTQKQCDAIITPILQAGLPCSGIVRTFPRALVYGPIEYQGLGIPDLYTSQGISHIERILKYSNLDDDITGQLIRAPVEQLKLEIVCNGPSLSLPYDDFAKPATNCWIRQTWQFMDAHHIRTEETSPDFLLSRANDQLLIPLFHVQGIRDD